MKKLFIILMFLSFPVFADEINMTPQNTFSGYNNNGVSTKYPQLKKSLIIENEQRSDIMKPKSVKEMGNITPSSNSPMTYGKFPQNYDSSNMMLMQNIQNGMQNMFMGY